jgi:hypothetical protein
MSKTCNKCFEIKPLIFYHKNKSMKDGHHGMCKECRSKHDNWASRNKAHCSLRAKKYYENNKITCSEGAKNWYMNNKDRRMQLNKIWVSDNLEKVRINMKKQNKKSRDTLDDNFIKSQIVQRTKIKRKDIPKDLIELKRVQLLINREIRNKNVINNY